MSVLDRSKLRWILPVVALSAWPLCDGGEVAREAASGTVLGVGNPMFAQGSRALEDGRVAEGIRLTLAGMDDSTDPYERAAAHSNLCGGYALLHQWSEALEHCNKAIALDPSNWHSFNNRAAVYAARREYTRAMADLQSGLELAPQSATLLKSLSVVEHNQDVLTKHTSMPLRS